MSDKKDVNVESMERSALEKLAQALLAREMREAGKEAEERKRIEARQAQRDRNAKDQDISDIRKMRRCSHKKGRGQTIKGQLPDYNLSHHVFIDGSQYIRCLNCGMKWLPGDTAEIIYRDGKKYKNFTKKSWEDVLTLFADHSTNTTTKSEQVLQVGTPKSKDAEDDRLVEVEDTSVSEAPESENAEMEEVV